jgi:hypothetical protein
LTAAEAAATQLEAKAGEMEVVKMLEVVVVEMLEVVEVVAKVLEVEGVVKVLEVEVVKILEDVVVVILTVAAVAEGHKLAAEVEDAEEFVEPVGLA